MEVTDHDLQTQLTDHLAALAHRHATVSYALIGVLALFMAAGSVGAYFGYTAYNKALQQANAIEQQYNVDKLAYQKQLAADEAERAALEQAIAQRDRVSKDKTTQVLKDTTTAESLADLSEAYHGTLNFGSTPEYNGRLAFTVPQVNTFTVTKIDDDTMHADLQDWVNKAASLDKDLNGCKSTLNECDKTVGAYKKAAQASKWKKLLHGVEIGAGVVAAAALGHAL